jgi:hypothetical protein
MGKHIKRVLQNKNEEESKTYPSKLKIKKAINKIIIHKQKKHTTLFCKGGRRDQTYPRK